MTTCESGSTVPPGGRPKPSTRLLHLIPWLLALELARRFAGASLRPTPDAAKRAAGVSGSEATGAVAELPPLEDLVAPNGTIIGDVSWMLDFAVVAFPKSGTTFLKDHLNRTSETHVHEREFCMKRPSHVADFVRAYHGLHARLGQPRRPKTVKFGVKCPGVLYRANDLRYYAEYFPNTKFVVGVRHPVSWFASFYNYQSYRNVSLPSTSRLVGRCAKHGKVCTDRARFHAALARLGKTPMREPAEINLLFGTRRDEQRGGAHRSNDLGRESDLGGHRVLTVNGTLPNRVLLYELRQIHEEGASGELLRDLQRYLGIREDFPKILRFQQNKTRAIDICDSQHEGARRVLAEHGADARDWILGYFLKGPGVEASSPDVFRRLVGDWGRDPCSER